MTTGADEIYEKPELIRQLVASLPCAVCHHSNAPDNVRVVEHRGEVWVMAVKCSHCGTESLVFAMVKEEGREVITELTPQEWAKFREMPEISADDVLDVHEFLKDFDGDFIRLFKGR